MNVDEKRQLAVQKKEEEWEKKQVVAIHDLKTYAELEELARKVRIQVEKDRRIREFEVQQQKARDERKAKEELERKREENIRKREQIRERRHAVSAVIINSRQTEEDIEKRERLEESCRNRREEVKQYWETREATRAREHRLETVRQAAIDKKTLLRIEKERQFWSIVWKEKVEDKKAHEEALRRRIVFEKDEALKKRLEDWVVAGDETERRNLAAEQRLQAEYERQQQRKVRQERWLVKAQTPLSDPELVRNFGSIL